MMNLILRRGCKHGKPCMGKQFTISAVALGGAAIIYAGISKAQGVSLNAAAISLFPFYIRFAAADKKIYQQKLIIARYNGTYNYYIALQDEPPCISKISEIIINNLYSSFLAGIQNSPAR